MPTEYPLVSTLIVLPWTAAAGLLLFPGARAARRWALSAALVELLLALLVLLAFDDTTDKLQFIEQHAWIPSLEIDYLVGLDGLSVLFPLTTALLTVAVIVGSWSSIQSMVRLYLALVLTLEGLLIGIFAALDVALFFLFWELTVVPIYFLISLWGTGPRRRFAATQYALYMLIGGIPILFAIIMLALSHAVSDALPLPAGLTFNYLALLSKQADSGTQTAVFLLFLLGFGIKTPLVPFHTWLPIVALEGPAGLTALLTGLKLGAYGLLRLGIPLAPEAAVHFSALMSAMGVAGLFYGALLALRQQNLRAMLAYASISHVGLVVVAVSMMNPTSIQGALFQLVNVSLISGGLFLAAGFLQQRLGSTEQVHLGGLANPMPLLTSFVFLFLLAGLGVPGTSGFVADWLMLLGIFEQHTGLGLAVLMSSVLTAAYSIGFFHRAFLGPITRPAVNGARDVRRRELALLAGLTTFILILGLFPRLITGVTDTSTAAWVKRLGGGLLEQPSLFARATPDAQ